MPPIITTTIIEGIQQWILREQDPLITMIAPTKGKLSKTEMLLTKAFADQSRDIGWVAFFRGKISKYWKAAFSATLPKHLEKN